MKNKMVFLPLVILLAAVLSCNISLAGGPTLSPQQIDTLSAQTLIAIQWQTLAAGGYTPEVGPGVTAESPANTATYTMLPTVTTTATQTPTLTSTPTVTKTPAPCNWAEFIIDVTVLDNWETTPLDHFTKTWRLQNIGSCTWTSGYSLIFDEGDQMGAPDSQQLTPGTVAPGGTIDVSVNLLSPAAPGTYQGFFKLKASDSTEFGIGDDHNSPFWVKIKVVAPAPSLSTAQAENSIMVTPGNVGHVVATCPAGSVVVGGGFDGDLRLVAHNIGKSGNGWEAYAKNNYGSNQTLKAYAICLTGASVTTTQISHDKTLAGGTSDYTMATCPGGSVITGLGFAADPSAIWVYKTDTTGGNTQRVFGANFSAGNSIVRAMATCLTGAGATTVQATNSGTVPANSIATQVVNCPAGTVVTGGGFALSTQLNLIGLYKKSGANAMEVKILNLSAWSHPFTDYAMCLAIS